MAFKYAESVGIGHHYGGHTLVKQQSQCLHIDRAVRKAFHLHHFKPGHSRTRRIGSVSRIGHYDFRAARIAAAHMVGAYHHQSGEFAMRSGIGIERELTHASDFRQSRLQLVVCFKSPLRGIVRLVRVKRCRQCRLRGYLLVDPGIVLHGA